MKVILILLMFIPVTSNACLIALHEKEGPILLETRVVKNLWQKNSGTIVKTQKDVYWVNESITEVDQKMRCHK